MDRTLKRMPGYSRRQREKQAREMVIDLEQMFWGQIKEAAAESPWMPKNYCMNDWVADVVRFLKSPRT